MKLSDPCDLWSASLVNKAFNKAATPKLYKTLTLQAREENVLHKIAPKPVRCIGLEHVENISIRAPFDINDARRCIHYQSIEDGSTVGGAGPQRFDELGERLISVLRLLKDQSLKSVKLVAFLDVRIPR